MQVAPNHSLLHSGSAKIDITPPLTIPYLGFVPRHALFDGVHDPLIARAVSLDDGTTAAVVIAADAIGYSNAILGPQRNFTQELRQRITTQTGVPGAHIMLAASHAHSTPETLNVRRLLDTPAAAAWLEVLLDQLASVAMMAWRQRKPCRLTVGKGAVHDLARNRRVIGRDGRTVGGPETTPDLTNASAGPLDPSVRVALIEALDDATRTVLVNFACHPVTVQVQPFVSADFPGVAMAMVERSLPGCTNALFLQGACGNLNPIRNTTDFADVERYGLMLGGEVVKLAAQLTAPDACAEGTTVALQSEIINLAVRDLPARPALQQAYDEASRKSGATTDSVEQVRHQSELRLAEEALILIDRGLDPIAAEIQIIHIGGLALVALPGEPFVELGLTIQQQSPASHTFVIGYANDYIGYLPTTVAWEQGGYEVALGPWTRVGKMGGAQLAAKAVTMLHAHAASTTPSV